MSGQARRLAKLVLANINSGLKQASVPDANGRLRVSTLQRAGTHNSRDATVLQYPDAQERHRRGALPHVHEVGDGFSL